MLNLQRSLRSGRSQHMRRLRRPYLYPLCPYMLPSSGDGVRPTFEGGRENGSEFEKLVVTGVLRLGGAEAGDDTPPVPACPSMRLGVSLGQIATVVRRLVDTVRGLLKTVRWFGRDAVVIAGCMVART